MQIDYVRLFIIAIIPGIALALGLYLTDRFDREPVKLLFKLFIFGMLSAIPTIIVEYLLSSFNIFVGILNAAYSAFIVASLTEEYFKRLVVIKFAYNHPAFNEKLDGIIYCAFSALGFATIENIIYVVFRFSNNPYIGYSRGILSVPAHMLFAVTMGYYLSLAKFCPYENIARHFYRKALLVPILLHGIFDFILMSNVTLLMLLFIPFVIFLWIFNLKKLNIYYKESKESW